MMYLYSLLMFLLLPAVTSTVIPSHAKGTHTTAHDEQQFHSNSQTTHFAQVTTLSAGRSLALDHSSPNLTSSAVRLYGTFGKRRSRSNNSSSANRREPRKSSSQSKSRWRERRKNRSRNRRYARDRRRKARLRSKLGDKNRKSKQERTRHNRSRVENVRKKHNAVTEALEKLGNTDPEERKKLSKKRKRLEERKKRLEGKDKAEVEAERPEEQNESQKQNNDKKPPGNKAASGEEEEDVADESEPDKPDSDNSIVGFQDASEAAMPHSCLCRRVSGPVQTCYTMRDAEKPCTKRDCEPKYECLSFDEFVRTNNENEGGHAEHLTCLLKITTEKVERDMLREGTYCKARQIKPRRYYAPV